MVQDDVIFAATGVTKGSILNGLRRDGDAVLTETLLLRSKTGERRRVACRHPQR